MWRRVLVFCSWVSSTGRDRGRHHQPPSPISVCAGSSRCFPERVFFLRAKERKRLGGKSCLRVFLLRQVRKSDDDAETRARWTRVRDATAQYAEGTKMSFWSLLSMKGQVHFMLQSYGVMLLIKWNRLTVISRAWPHWLQWSRPYPIWSQKLPIRSV